MLNHWRARNFSLIRLGLNMAEQKRSLNRLANEKSSYLQQHAHNPVNWYAWTPDAFEKSRKENKPIFLSIGYSTCHWCHVMEHESFENNEIAKILNDHYVAIKVDREERPDVDQVYMKYLQSTEGGGGWPLSVWLTPQLQPFFAGTYFPPTSEHRYGRPGFKEILVKLNEAWSTKSNEIINGSKDSIEQLATIMDKRATTTENNSDLLTNTSIETCFAYFANDFDDDNGGFGTRPKFPQPVNFNFLLTHAALSHQAKGKADVAKLSIDMTQLTLKKMSLGGINDQLGKGFHRYSTDDLWHVPHFEKMLYDQGQIAVVLADTYSITKDELIGQTLRDLVSYVEHDLRHSKHGGFYCAEDADSLPTKNDTKKKEGAFYAWNYDELHKLLPENHADIFCYYYQCKKNGNVDPMQDPHDELKNQNVLITDGNHQATVEKFQLKNITELKEILSACHKILLNYRNENRPRPHRDEKFLASWNGLMISGLARAACVLQESKYTQLAEQAIHFIRTYLIDSSTKRLLRACYIDQKIHEIEYTELKVNGFLDDYAFVIQACIDLYETNLNEDLLIFAYDLQKQQDEFFWDSNKNRYFNTDGKDASIILRLSEDHDGAEPAPNAVSALNLLRLGHYFNDSSLHDRLQLLFKSYTRQLSKMPMTMPTMIRCFEMYTQGMNEIIIQSSNPEEIIQYIQTSYVPNKIIINLNKKTNHKLIQYNKELTSFIDDKTNEQTRIFLCRNFQCQLPVSSLKEFKEKFDPLILTY
ncbi:unnamed protein product [Adineta steineri]|uniref:Spermatogenesis-associated protein 20-like TRX domain-containing protein n=1 Tax=Adineta steineri TaxID=433720 RepID=A0A815SJJ8_9BILA|nr:unnamed protein product [Adineta steineri]CAF1640915.1 unnamed protein product [Adineta steineri]